MVSAKTVVLNKSASPFWESLLRQERIRLRRLTYPINCGSEKLRKSSLWRPSQKKAALRLNRRLSGNQKLAATAVRNLIESAEFSLSLN